MNMKLNVNQQLELYTAMEFPPWLPTDDRERIRVMNAQRGRWLFTPDQLRRHLNDHPSLMDRYLRHCESLIGSHDKVVLVREGIEYTVYDQQHGKEIGVQRFKDFMEAVVTWLEYRYMN